MINLPEPEWLQTVDSTNTYLLQRFEEQTHMPDGTAVVAKHQTKGRGQRSKKWVDTEGRSLLLSVGGRPAADLAQQAFFCFGIAVAVAITLEELYHIENLTIKWPNDLYIGSQKLGGILIENILRGSEWQVAVVGIGINLLSQEPDHSFIVAPAFLARHTAATIDVFQLARHLQQALTNAIINPVSQNIMSQYNRRLYRRGELQTFETAGIRWTGVVGAALPEGGLLVQSGEAQRICTHGVDLWIPNPVTS